MNTIETKRSYLGKTAHQWIKIAEVSESQAGIPEIFADGHILDMTDDELVVSCYGHVAVLSMSDRDVNKMRKLLELAEKR
jgi:hypothetical protein